MTADAAWSRIKDLFHAVQSIPAHARADWLDNACGGDRQLHDDVAALLAAQREPPPILAGTVASLLDAITGNETDDDHVGRRVGAYRLLRLIGEGGMGRVYLAERVDDEFRQRVALKQIRLDLAGGEARARFLREREILARLIHPSIAQLHDGGVGADGAPYFTLELVDGEPVTRWCDRAALGIRRRVELLLQVCAAVAYAHSNLIVHRDLKPSNILVTEDGTPKLLDFGIAKLLDIEHPGGLTAADARVLTREYAAPEQVLGEPITTATDVYALGVLLYGLLSGRTPYPRAESGASSWAKAIVEDEPPALTRVLHHGGDIGAAEVEAIAERRSTSLPRLRRQLRGDLQRIVERALAKSVDARYPTVDAFAGDLRAYLSGQPIRGETRVWRMRKFIRRHWLPLGAISLALLIAASGLIAVTVEARARQREAEHALHEARTTAAVKDFLLGLFAGADPRSNAGKTIGVRDLLDKGAAHVDNDLGSQPALQAELKSVLGGIYARLGLYAQAMPLQEQAIAAFDAAGRRDQVAANTIGELALAARTTGDAARAERLFDEQIARYAALADATPADLLHALYFRTFIATDNHRFDEALTFAERAEAIARAHPEQPGLLGDALQAKASAHWGLHAYANAETELKAAIERHEQAGAPYRMSIGVDQRTLALIYSETGRFVEALALDDRAFVAARDVMGEDHPYVSRLRVDTAEALYHLGKYAEAEARLRQSLRSQRELVGADSPYLAVTLGALGAVCLATDRPDAAAPVLAEARAIWTRLHGADYAHVLDMRSDLALVELLRGKPASAAEAWRGVIADRARLHDADTAIDAARLGEALRQMGQLREAIEREREALAIAQRLHGDESWQAAAAKRYLGATLIDAQEPAEAATVLGATIAYYDALARPADHPLAAQARVDLARALGRRAATRAESARVLTAALRQHERLWGAADARTRAVAALAKRISSP